VGSILESDDIKKAGLKVTLPRLKILKILESNTHLSAEEIYQMLKESGDDVGLATVYRVLTQFETAGLVMRHRFEGEHAVYEIETGEHHDHLVCVRCGKVDEFIDKTIEDRQRKIAKEKGYRMTDHQLYIYGYCSDCDKKSH